MYTKTCWLVALAAATSAIAGPVARGEDELDPLPLPAPRMEGGISLMKALEARKSSRDYSSRKVPLPVLSGMLWAGFGINRPETDQRTAPSAMNSQEVDIYLFCASEGLATVVHEVSNRKTLAERMGPGPDQRIILAQSVGYPK